MLIYVSIYLCGFMHHGGLTRDAKPWRDVPEGD